ncbi:hypothetical protein [Paraburkholderia sp. HP33-1]|uniref:hypothetical protein n=1 Tax=Paraburkholderia sp. HP33-1 TaxID=2883243 RepID=UPI001F3B188D|nr:hypothetical protein [Paraburkholderia sp. HP33-1]
MDIIDMARASGMTVILDGKIGREEYQSVCGSLSALQRFAEAVRHSNASSKGNPIFAAQVAQLQRHLAPQRTAVKVSTAH